jgi:hypothetical protein
MIAMNCKRLLGRAALALSLALSANAALADVLLTVNINTASFGAGSAGFLDFQFNPAGVGQPLATATMNSLNGFDLSKFGAPDGDVAVVPGGFQFSNTSPLNALLYEATFGGVFSFNLIFGGDAIDAVSSRFSVSAYDDQFNAAGGLADPLLLTLDWSLSPSGAPAVTPTVVDGAASAAAVPEPSSLMIAALGLGLLGFMRRRQA